MASAFSIWMFSTHFSHEGCAFHFSLVGVTIDRAIPAVMDAASISSYSLAQLVYFLWLIARELCNRFGAPIENTPAGASSGVQPPPVLETPFQCAFHCKYCRKRCTRRKPGHSGHSCFEHKDRRD